MSLPNQAVSQRAVEAFLNGIVFQLYARAKGESATRLTVPVIADGNAVRTVLTNPAQFPKSMGLIGSLGNSRFNTNGSEWETRRDLTQKFYLSAGSSHSTSTVAAIYHARLARCDATRDSIQRALMLAATEVFFGALDCEVDVERFYHVFDRARQHVKRLQYFSWNLASESDAHALNEEAGELADAFGAEVERSPQLGSLMTAFRSRARGLPGFNPHDELLMNFFAGIETTAATLSFAIDRLGVDPSVQQRLHDEIAANQGEPYLNCFIQETLRYFPTVPFVVRETASEVVLEGNLLASGQPLLISIVGLHHDPANWSDPDIFDCSRAEFLNDSYDRRAFLPFLAGPRMCGGARLARVELIEGFKAVIRQFSVKGGSDEIGFDYGLALRPRASAPLAIARRAL